jgi:CelD/BcsL family acetyltransferase involved in cellulose biosynthesis
LCTALRRLTASLSSSNVDSPLLSAFLEYAPIVTEGVKVAVCTRMQEMAAHNDEWRRLAVATGSIFVTPEWVEAWFEVYGSDFEPSIRYVTQDGRLVAIMPLMTGPDGSLRFVGDGVGDVFAPLLAPDAPPGTLEALFETLQTHSGKLLILTNVQLGEAWRRTLKNGLGQVALVDRQAVLPYLDLSGLDWPGFLASRSAGFRKRLSYNQRALERSHVVQFRLANTREELAADLDRLFDLHDQRWATRGGSAISSPRTRAFMASVCRRAHDQGWLRLWTLEIDGIPAAASMGWRVGGRYAYYLPGFDPAYGNRSPGLLLLARTVEAAIEEGASEYDFLLGDEEYKSRFANAVRHVETEILGPRWSSHLLVVRCERTLRRIGRVLPAPARARVHSAVQRVQHPLPWGRYR